MSDGHHRHIVGGHHQEPPSRFGNKGRRERQPIFHSHSARPKRHPKTGGRKR